MNNYDATLRAIGEASALIAAITYTAYEYWEKAGCTEDFCLQHSDLDSGILVFGSINRVAWHMDSGFRILPEFCTKRFLKAQEPSNV